MAINLYLAKKHSRTLYPQTLEGEALAWQWTIWAMTDLEPPVLALTVNRLFLPDEPRDLDAEASDARRLAGPIAVLDGVLGERPYLLGDGFSVVDLNLASVLTNLHMAQVGLEGAPRAYDWLERCLTRPAAQATLADRTLGPRLLLRCYN